MGRYVEVTVSTVGLTQTGRRAPSTIGMVGRAVGSNFTLNTAYTIISPSEAADLFGTTSALYQSILRAFSEGASKIIAVPADVTAESQETFSGDGSETEFTLSKSPAQPLDSVTVDSVAQTEGEDFYVDYGNGKVIFYTAPASGTDNVAVDFSAHTAAQIETAIAVLEEVDVGLVCGAMMFDSALLEKIKAHCDTMRTDLPRMATYMLKNAETTLTLATTLASQDSILIMHKSLQDVASLCAGTISSYQPWTDMTSKPVENIVQTGRFTSSEIAAADAAFVVTMYDPPKQTGNAKVFSTGWTLDADRDLGFIDQVRVAYFFKGILEFGLTTPKIIGTIRINRNGMRELDNYIASLLNPYVANGVIDGFTIVNAARNLLELQDPDETQIQQIITLQANRRLEDAYKIQVQVIYAGTAIFIGINLALTGGVA